MFSHTTILLLRQPLPGRTAALPICGYFKDYHFVRTVMETKQHLLRCLRNMRPSMTPDFILIDHGSRNEEIKRELERWIEEHPQLWDIQVIFPGHVSIGSRILAKLSSFMSRSRDRAELAEARAAAGNGVPLPRPVCA